MTYQSSNFVQSPLNHSRSETILFGITAYMLLFIVTSAGAIDISLSDLLFVSLEASFMIFKDPNISNNVSRLFILYELILSFFVDYFIYVSFFVWQ